MSSSIAFCPGSAWLAHAHMQLDDAKQHFLALSSAGRVFALPLAPVVRVLAWGPEEAAQLTHRGVVELRGDHIPIAASEDVWSAPAVEQSQARHLVLLDWQGDVLGMLVDQALTVFSCRMGELLTYRQSAPTTSDLILGFCPWSALSNYLVRQALPANQLARSLIATHGPLRMEEGQLFAGLHQLNADTTIVDEVHRRTGFGCTIFQQSVRIATTATKAGSNLRAIGTRANAEVTRTTLLQGREYRGIARTIGKDWAIVYTALRDSGREIVGMLATFTEVSSRIFPILEPAAMIGRMRR